MKLPFIFLLFLFLFSSDLCLFITFDSRIRLYCFSDKWVHWRDKVERRIAPNTEFQKTRAACPESEIYAIQFAWHPTAAPASIVCPGITPRPSMGPGSEAGVTAETDVTNFSSWTRVHDPVRPHQPAHEYFVDHVLRLA